jgi:hypothetical protein
MMRQMDDWTNERMDHRTDGWNDASRHPLLYVMLCVGIAYQGKKDIVFRFVIEYNSSLRDFGP